MKKFKLLFLVLTLILSLSLGVVACGGDSGSGSGTGDGGDTPKEPVIVKVEGTKGLKYELKTNSMKGTKYAICTGIGTATDKDIVIASHYEGYLVKEVKQAAFKGNTNITSVKMVNGMQKLNLYTFQNCTSLQSVILPETLKSIGQNAFDGCEMLLNVCNDSEIEIKKGDTMNGAVGNYACNIYSSKGGGAGVFATEGDFETFEFPGNKYIIKYTGNPAEINFPAGTTGIYKDVFKDNALLTEVTFPKDLTYIGKAAFSGCTALKKVEFPSGTKIKEFGTMAFAGCEALEEFNYGGTLTEYLDIDFTNDTANPLKFSKTIRINGQIPYNLEIPSGITNIKACAFVNFQDLKTIVFPESVEIIEPFAFAYSTVETFSFKGTSKLKEFKNNAFAHCPKLKELRLPKSVEKITLQAFTECDSLLTVLIENNNNLQEIADKAFYHCSNLRAFAVGHNSQLKKIGADCFYQCRKLAKFTLGNNSKLESIGASGFRECKPIKELYLPATCVKIGDWCFSGCFESRETDDLQLYSAASERPSGWGNYFNSSNIDVFFGRAYPVLPEDLSSFIA